jgi:hypothetical protein
MNKKLSRFDEAIGWTGAISLMGAYMLSSFGFLSAQSYPYQLLNIFGALFIIYISYKKQVYQSVILNLMWFIIGIIAFIQIIL